LRVFESCETNGMTEEPRIPFLYLDAMAFIFLIEGEPAVSEPVKILFDVLRTHRGIGVTSELTLAEVLAGSGQVRNPPVKRMYLDLIVWSRFLDLVPVSREVLYDSADLRFLHKQAHGKKLKLPDAIHLATAIQKRCRYFMSQDDGITPPIEMRKIRPVASGVAEMLRALA
jgi:predicted nucleic acid-binding protein